MRLFVAIDLPREIKNQLAMISCGLPGALRVDSRQLHLTLRFIGEVNEVIFRDIRQSLDEIRARSFQLQLQGTGFFPPRKKPRVVWVGVAKNENLIHLQKKIESSLQQTGLAPEGRKFSPHITLARLKNTPPARVGRFLQDYGLFSCKPFAVHEFTLYSSVLNSRGAKHFPEQVYPLSA